MLENQLNNECNIFFNFRIMYKEQDSISLTIVPSLKKCVLLYPYRAAGSVM